MSCYLDSVLTGNLQDSPVSRVKLQDAQGLVLSPFLQRLAVFHVPKRRPVPFGSLSCWLRFVAVYHINEIVDDGRMESVIALAGAASWPVVDRHQNWKLTR